MAAAVFGTFLTTFAVVLNNHLPAAVSAPWSRSTRRCAIWFDGERRLAVLRRWPGCSRAFAGGQRAAGPVAVRAAWRWRCCGRRRRRRCWPTCRRRPWWRPRSSAPTGSPTTTCSPPYMHRSATDPATTGTTTTYERNGERTTTVRATGSNAAIGHRRRGRASSRGRLRAARAWSATTASSRSRRSGSSAPSGCACGCSARATAAKLRELALLDRRGHGGLPGLLPDRAARTSATTAA